MSINKTFCKTLRKLFWLNLQLAFGLWIKACGGCKASKQVSRKRTLGGFYRCPVGLFRGTKQAYYCYLTEYTFQLIMRLKEKAKRASIQKWLQNHKYTRAKYLRKFANDMMTSERLNIPESVADFIQGRVPKTVGRGIT